MASLADRRRQFRALHDAGCFVIPNPWDEGSARYLATLGFKALATTSAGYAYASGRADGAVPRDAELAYIAALVAATDLPVNADFEAGYADDPEGVAESVRLCIATGVAGLSIEDARVGARGSLYTVEQAVARMRAARAAIDASGAAVLLVGRAECFLVGQPDLAETIRRLKAYAEAGADCLYAPGIRTRAEIEAVVQAVAPKPVNLLMSATGDLTFQDAAAMGVRRISVGAALARAAWSGFIEAARLIADAGRFDHLAAAVPGKTLNALFASRVPGGPD
jgi:2-methylisocitrate lyase-like PEP mutase family enzyme